MSQSVVSPLPWPVTGSVMEGAVAPAEEDVTEELARLLALKLRLAEVMAGGMGGAPAAAEAAEGPPLPALPALPMGGLTAMAGLTAAELSVGAVAAPGVEAPPEDERQSAVVAGTPLPVPLAPGDVMVGEMSSPLVPPLGVGDVTPMSCKMEKRRG